EFHLSQYLVEKEYLMYRITAINTKKRKSCEVLDAKLQQSQSKIKRLENEVDGLRNYICLLSTNNSKLKNEVEALTKKTERVKKNEVIQEQAHLNEEMVNITEGMINRNDEPSVQKLRETIVSLTKDNNLFKNQLEKKVKELKEIRQIYGKTIIALSSERRKTELLVKKTEKESKQFTKANVKASSIEDSHNIDVEKVRNLISVTKTRVSSVYSTKY
ncbi:hypothetical protein NQ314_008959, partial [Rhamnusium bicolor]